MEHITSNPTCYPPFAVPYNVKAQTGECEGTKEPESIHIAKKSDIAEYCNQDHNRNSCCEHDRVVRSAAYLVPLQYKLWKKFHTRKCHKHMIGPDNSSVAGKHKQRTGTNRYFCL